MDVMPGVDLDRLIDRVLTFKKDPDGKFWLDAAGARMVGTTDRQLPIDKQGGGGAWILHWTKHGSPPIMEWRSRWWPCH